MVRIVGIESVLYGFRVVVVVFYVIGENYKLGNIGKMFEFRVLKVFIDMVLFG